MPLIILGLLTLICLLAYAIVQYISSGEEDSRPVRERYPHAFDEPDDTIIFPSSNIEEEKRKRNIKS